MRRFRAGADAQVHGRERHVRRRGGRSAVESLHPADDERQDHHDKENKLSSP